MSDKRKSVLVSMSRVLGRLREAPYNNLGKEFFAVCDAIADEQRSLHPSKYGCAGRCCQCLQHMCPTHASEASTGADLPQFMRDEFDAFLECAVLAHGFLRPRCGDCGHDKLVAFSCKRRGFCPSCGARRMAQTAAHRVDHVIGAGSGTPVGAVAADPAALG